MSALGIHTGCGHVRGKTMAISLWVGLPGAGKTTLMASHAYKLRKKYRHVYTNVDMDIPGVIRIEPDYLGMYDIRDGVVLLDEGSIWADSRDYKSMTKRFSNWLMLHRHYRCDVRVYTQRFNGVDVKIRNLCTHVYYVQKSGFFGRWVTQYTPIRYALIVPKDGDKVGDIVEGYQQLSFLERLFRTRYCLRPLWYRYFDSWAAPALPPLPQK